MYVFAGINYHVRFHQIFLRQNLLFNMTSALREEGNKIWVTRRWRWQRVQ